MATCTSCGHDVNGKKFCPACGTPVQAMPAEAATTSCPRCSGSVKTSAAFCMHCGSSLGAQALAASSAPVTAIVQPATRQCPACHAEVASSSAFCTNCGQSMSTGQTPAPVTTAPGQVFCTNCGSHNNPGSRFCNNCGQSLVPGAPVQNSTYQPYGQPNTSYPQQPPYNPNYAQPYGQPQYNAGYPQQSYGQPGYQPVEPMLGQAPLILRCPVCMAMSPQGTPACPSCRTSLAGVVPTPGAVPMQGQQQGAFGGMFQGNRGNMAMGALGGAAAVIGGEMLLHNMERRNEYDRDGYGYGERRHEGVLGELGELGDDIGLF